VKSTYFGSGDDRSSNDWYEKCDLILVAGTPRIPTDAVTAYLVQIGETKAACQQPVWETIYWDGQTESGEAVRVSARGYQDDTWRRAHREIVRAQLVQAIGRGRGILETGCEVIVLSNEECGLVISDAGLESLNGTSIKVLDAIRNLTLAFSKKDYLGKASVSTREIARAVGLSLPRVRHVLGGLERRGLVQKLGERSGWALVAQGAAACPT
jgi:DNA-binding transcriptional ArsR family regulator